MTYVDRYGLHVAGRLIAAGERCDGNCNQVATHAVACSHISGSDSCIASCYLVCEYCVGLVEKGATIVGIADSIFPAPRMDRSRCVHPRTEKRIELLMQYLSEHRAATTTQVAKLLGMKVESAYALLRVLAKEGRVVAVAPGRGNEGLYRLAK